MKKHWNKFRLSKKYIAFLMSSASVFSDEMTMIVNSYLTFFKIFSADPAIRRCFWPIWRYFVFS